MTKRQTFIFSSSQLWLIALCMVLLPCAARAFDNPSGSTCWVGTWASSPQLAEAKDIPAEMSGGSVMLRQFVRVSTGGNKIRVRLSNAFGTTPLVISSAQVAIATGVGKVEEGTAKELAFDGEKTVSIPAGALAVSDPVDLSLPYLGDVAITMQLDGTPAGITTHPGSRTTSFIWSGTPTGTPDLSQAVKIDRWYFINGIDVESPSCAGSVAIIGDSITDGRGSTTNGNDRWPDLLMRRIEATGETRGIGVLNHGIGGNRVLRDGLGPNALARFDRDVIAQTGVRWLIVFEGVNDIGTRIHSEKTNQSWATAGDIISGFKQMILRAHTHGMKAYAATITPFGGSFYDSPETEEERTKVNQWILTSGSFDGVVDFDKIVRNPQEPDRLLPAYDSGDHLHLSPAGYTIMADAVPLSWFGGKQEAPEKPKIAITFDDLPAHGPLPPGVTRMDVITKIAAALKEGHVPPTYGFMNGMLVEEQPADVEVLRAWRAAGNPLGNHTWSHINLNQHRVEEFENDFSKNEPMLKELMGNQNSKWLRFPYLAEGDTPEKRAAVRKFLAERGYKIAGVTMSFGDYMWTDTYARCSAQGDSKAIAEMKSAFLSSAAENADYSRQLAQLLYGHDIPYVLLMHVGALDAEMLPELLQLYRSLGFDFVSLAEAESNPFYTNDIHPGRTAGPDSLEGALKAKHIGIPPPPAVPLSFDKMCR
ncbi:MAG TPA: GDSL-type esterase/lipase family protein [Terriglobales bacterium]|nr:GDSL-type esterase/lipase family protein [Terriglobales bacterium]